DGVLVDVGILTRHGMDSWREERWVDRLSCWRTPPSGTTYTVRSQGDSVTCGVTPRTEQCRSSHKRCEKASRLVRAGGCFAVSAKSWTSASGHLLTPADRRPLRWTGLWGAARMAAVAQSPSSRTAEVDHARQPSPCRPSPERDDHAHPRALRERLAGR